MKSARAFMLRRRWPLFAFTLFLLAGITFLAPLEQTLGWRSRAVYFHGVWVWSGKIAFALASLSGLAEA